MTSRTLPADSLALTLLKAAAVVEHVMEDGRSLQDAIDAVPEPCNRPAVQDLSYATLRQWRRACALVDVLTGKRPLRPPALGYLLATSLAVAVDDNRERYTAHTLVDQAVTAADSDPGLRPGKGLLNACLRRFFRERESLLTEIDRKPAVRWNCPDWWVERLKKQQPAKWSSILEVAQSPAPLVLRVNRRKTDPAAFVSACEAAGLVAKPLDGGSVWLPQPVPVARIPGFFDGHVSVQDWAAQQAAPLLDPSDGMRVLDACCAPGGKTGHLLELADLNLTALDVDAKRLRRVSENLDRLGLYGPAVTLTAADATRLSDWWDGEPFDAILADVPCTGSGVVRRHPDIYWLRRPQDVASMSQLQTRLLNVLWSVLRPGGTFLMVTCSIFGEEGEQLLARFLDKHPDAVPLPAPGLILPSSQSDGPGHDGFFYAKLQKAALTQA